ncbi:MAG: LapA family protein [Synechococcus sp.]|nr:LapA family protein [Synechococcus sp.]
MQTLGRLMAMALLAAVIGAVAVASIQNIELVSIKFLVWQSVQLPFGILLAFGIGLGLVLGSFISIGSSR